MEGARAHQRSPLQHLLDLASGDVKQPKSLPALLVHAPAEARLVRRACGRRAACSWSERPIARSASSPGSATPARQGGVPQAAQTLDASLAVAARRARRGTARLIGMHVLVSVRVGFRWIWK